MEGSIFQSERSDAMIETDVLSHEITARLAQQREAWRELAKPELYAIAAPEDADG